MSSEKNKVDLGAVNPAYTTKSEEVNVQIVEKSDTEVDDGCWLRTCWGKLIAGLIAVAAIGGLVAMIVCLTGNCGGTDANDPCSKFVMVSRAEWGARNPKAPHQSIPAASATFLHHTVTSHCTDQERCSELVRAMQNFHMDDNGWNDIGYSFLIGEDGSVYEGVGWQNLGTHTADIYNPISHGISIIGNFMEVLPATVATDAAKNLMECGVKKGHVLEDYELFGHRDGRCTLCPGDLLYKDLQTWPHYSTRRIWRVCANCEAIEFVSREEWGAREPMNRFTDILPTNLTFLHHTEGRNCSDKDFCMELMRGIQDWHMDANGWNDIGYNWLVGEDGRAYEGRGWLHQGAHAPTYNSISHGISIIGSFSDRLPKQVAMDTAKALIECGATQGYIQEGYELFGHRDGRCTTCPGDALYADLQTWPHYSTRQIPIYC